MVHDEKRYVQAEEIAGMLHIPRHFASKILKNLSKQGVLISVKGPAGGFALNDKSLSISIYDIVALTDGIQGFSNCVLLFSECNNSNPCPMHCQMAVVKNQLQNTLTCTTIGDLLHEDKKNFLKSITGKEETDLIKLTSTT
jgi:Rrf2 family protein